MDKSLITFTTDAALIDAIRKYQSYAPDEFTDEKNAILTAVYTFTLRNYMPSLKVMLRRYGKSDIRPYDFHDVDGFRDFLSDILSDKFVLGNALKNFDTNKQDFKGYLFTICRHKLVDIINKNNIDLSPDGDVTGDDADVEHRESIAATYPLLFEDDLDDRKMLYCSHKLLSLPTDVRHSLSPTATSVLLQWRPENA